MKIQILLEKLKEEIKLRNFSKETQKNYGYNTKKFLEWLIKNKEKINNNSIRKYFLECEKIYDINTLKLKKASIKFFIINVLKKEHTTFDVFIIPSKGKKQLPKVLSKEEILKILSNLKNPKHNLIISLLYSSGLRLSEVINLKRSNFDLNRNIILIEQGKGKKDRLTILSKKVKEKILFYLTNTNFSTKYLFESNRKQRYSKKSIQEILKKASTNLNKNVTPHMLRHSFATHLLEEGIDIKYIQRLLGHSKLETTSLYTHVAKNKIEEIISPYDRL